MMTRILLVLLLLVVGSMALTEQQLQKQKHRLLRKTKESSTQTQLIARADQTHKVDATKVDATKVDATKVDATKVDATKVDATTSWGQSSGVWSAVQQLNDHNANLKLLPREKQRSFSRAEAAKIGNLGAYIHGNHGKYHVVHAMVHWRPTGVDFLSTPGKIAAAGGMYNDHVYHACVLLLTQQVDRNDRLIDERLVMIQRNSQVNFASWDNAAAGYKEMITAQDHILFSGAVGAFTKIQTRPTLAQVVANIYHNSGMSLQTYFLTYDPVKYNCQQFTWDILKALYGGADPNSVTAIKGMNAFNQIDYVKVTRDQLTQKPEIILDVWWGGVAGVATWPNLLGAVGINMH